MKNKLVLSFLLSISLGSSGVFAQADQRFDFIPAAEDTSAETLVEKQLVQKFFSLLDETGKSVVEAEQKSTPQSLDELIDAYAKLGQLTVQSEATLLWASEGLLSNKKSFYAEYLHMKSWSLSLLNRIGKVYGRIQPVFGPLVHGPNAWKAIPVKISDDRGDGRPLYYYRDTYKRLGSDKFDLAKRKSEFQGRLKKFTDGRGKFSDITTVEKGTFSNLEFATRYDYVMDVEGKMRIYNTDEKRFPKIGHSVLASGGPEFTDASFLLAGEVWALYNSQGGIEAFYISNTSGHFLPDYEDLRNSLPYLAKFGVPSAKIVLFGGPNETEEIFAEIAQVHKRPEIMALVPKEPKQWLADFLN